MGVVRLFPIMKRRINMTGVNAVSMAQAARAYQLAKESNEARIRERQQQIQQENIQLQAAQRIAMECTVYPFVGGNVDVYV